MESVQLRTVVKGGKEEPGKARRMEGRDAAGDSEVRGGAKTTTDQGGARGSREPGRAWRMTGHGEAEGALSQGEVDDTESWGGVQGLEA